MATLQERAKALKIKAARAEGEDDLALDAEAFARCAAELFATHPLRVVRLWKATGDELAAALARPELATVQELVFSGNKLKDVDMQALANAPHLESLQSLDFEFCGLSGKTVAALVKADPRRLPALRSIVFYSNKLGPVGFRALSESLLVEQFTSLNLASNAGSDETVAQLLSSRAIRNLETLNLGSSNGIGPLSIKALSESAFTRRLTFVTGLDATAIKARNEASPVPYDPPAAPTGPLGEATAPKAAVARSDDARGPELVAMLAEDPGNRENLAVYADWLQERGDMRGELIALELRDDPKLESKKKIPRTRIAKDFAQRFKNKSAEVVFENGLIVHMSGTMKWLFEQGPAIFQREPIRSLELNSVTAAGLAKLPSLPGMDRIRYLKLAFSSAASAPLVPWSALPRLKLSIQLDGRHMEKQFERYAGFPIGALHFVPDDDLGHLETLIANRELRGIDRFAIAWPGPEAADVLVTAPWKLTRLRVHRKDIDEASIAKLEARFGKILVLDNSWH